MTSGTFAAPPAPPSDVVRRVMWRLDDQPEVLDVAAAARRAARGPVAHAVASGARAQRDWTAQKQRVLEALEQAGLGRLWAVDWRGGRAGAPATLAAALAAFELAWVDGGAAACSVALNLALAPIAMFGTPEQQRRYLQVGSDDPAAPAGSPGRAPRRGAFCLTEPPPYAGVDTGMLGGRARVVQWPADGAPPVLEIEKQGRFTTNMDFADFVVAAVASDDPRLEGTFMVILEQGDPGRFDRGPAAAKLAHPLTSTRHPSFRLRVPATRILGGYELADGVIRPKWDVRRVVHGVLARTRVPVGAMTAAKVLSAAAPVMRYQRQRFRGGRNVAPGSPRWELGLQAKQDALHRLVDVWAAGESAASLALAAARYYDSLDSLARRAEQLWAEAAERTEGGRRAARQQAEQRALERLELAAAPDDERDDARLRELEADPLAELLIRSAVADVLSPAAKLWATSRGAAALREALQLVGGASVVEECPAFLPYKWMDAQLDAIYEGPESAQRRQLVRAMTHPLLLAQLRQWSVELKRIASRRPGVGACTVGSALDLWLWTLDQLQRTKDADGAPVFREARQGATFPMADALCGLLAARSLILDVRRLQEAGANDPRLADSLPGYARFFTDLSHVQAAAAAGETARVAAELLFGYQRHPSWDAECGSCAAGGEVDAWEGLIPGIGMGARLGGDVLEADGTHAEKAGPCVRFPGLDEFARRRALLDGCLAGARLAKDRAARMLTQMPIPERPEYPA